MNATELKAESLRLIDLVETTLYNLDPFEAIPAWIDARLKQAQVLATLATVK